MSSQDSFFKNKNRLGKFDIIINTHSFQEMDRNVRDSYIKSCCHLLRSNGLFFNANWEQYKMSNRDGSTYINTPLDYTYPVNTKKIFFLEDPMQKLMRTRSNYKSGSKGKRGTLGFITIIKKDPYWIPKLLNQLKAIFQDR